MEKAGVIEKVTEPTEWVRVIHIVYKLNSKLFICQNPRNLNKANQREHFKISDTRRSNGKNGSCESIFENGLFKGILSTKTG